MQSIDITFIVKYQEHSYSLNVVLLIMEMFSAYRQIGVIEGQIL